MPTPKNSQKLNGEGGRGSAVWFNQATMFQTAELGYNTVAEAEESVQKGIIMTHSVSKCTL